MSIISFLNELDQSLLLFFNGFHNEFWDMVMLMFTRKEIWLPLYCTFGILIIRKYGFKSILILAVIALAITFSDQTSVLVKESVKRLRPTHDPLIANLVHNIYTKGGAYGFFSSHASNTVAVAFLTSKLFNNKRYTVTIFAWALIVSYSRIYLGVHYPFDVLAGIIWGLVTGYILYQLLMLTERKLSWTRFPNIAEIKLTKAESICFTLITVVMIAVIMLVIWKLQKYNYL